MVQHLSQYHFSSDNAALSSILILVVCDTSGFAWLTGRGQQSDSYIAGSNHAMTLARMHVASLLL
eukprot:COSAG06_NODE_27029_length_602_cov_6.664016_1_plen_64_part_10